MSRSFGLSRARDMRAREQLSKTFSFPAGTIQPLPAGTPGTVTPSQLGITDATPLRIVFTGDTGGVADPRPQGAVCWALSKLQPDPAFLYHLGDIFYYNGDASVANAQFYEPNSKLPWPIVAIPGNHDGDPDPAVSDPTQTGIATFMANFCSGAPVAPPTDQQLEYGRHTQTQPYCDWVLEMSAVTIIGLWTNVPSGGHLWPSQQTFLESALAAAPTDRPLILCGHHPMFSVDAYHGGSKLIYDAYTQAFAQSNRCPDLILAGHVHDYQRFTWKYGGRSIPVVVQGNSGYHNLHALAGDAKPGLDVNGDGSVILEYGDDSAYGYTDVTISAGRLSGMYCRVVPGTAPDFSDTAVTVGVDTF